MMTLQVKGHRFALVLAVAGMCLLSSSVSAQQQSTHLEANNPVAVSSDPAHVEPALAEVELESLPLGQPHQSRALDAATGGRPSARSAGSGMADPTQSEIVRVGLALGGVIALILLLRALIRRFGATSGMVGALGGRRPSGVLEVLGRFPTGRKQSMVLLKLGRRIVLVHQTPTGMQSLAEVVDPDEVASLLTRVEAGQRATTRTNARGVLKRLLTGKRTSASKGGFSSVLRKMQGGPWDADVSTSGAETAANDGQDVQSVLARASRREAGTDGSELVDLTRASKAQVKERGFKRASQDGETLA